MRKINRLTPIKVSKIKSQGRYRDGGGLLLQVSPTGTKSWQLRYERQGRERMMGLGGVDTVSLAEARARAREARQLIVDGKDPLDLKRQTIAAAIADAAQAMTFAQCADAYLAQHASTWRNDKHRHQWGTSLTTAKDAFGRLDVRAIDTPMVVKLLEPIWQVTPESGSRLRGRIEKVLDWATAGGFREGPNPARWKGHIEHLLKARPQAKHHEALPFAELPAFMQELRARDSVSASALELTILTASRTNEVIAARWKEFDLKAKLWIIPGDRMKAHKEHRVPLSDRAVEILGDLKRDRSGLVFPGAKAGKPISNMAMLQMLRSIKGNGFTVHGFRSSFRDWAGERTNYPREVIEHALAHRLPDKVEAAYRRGDALEKRRRLMTEWAGYCESTPVEGDNVLPLRA